jgi:hypothetical protein
VILCAAVVLGVVTPIPLLCPETYAPSSPPPIHEPQRHSVALHAPSGSQEHPDEGEAARKGFKRAIYPGGLKVTLDETDEWYTEHLSFKQAPPDKFDHYAGAVTVIEHTTERELRAVCGLSPEGVLAGCATIRTSKSCLIHLGPPQSYTPWLTRNMLLRHEMAHCNGWPPDHPGIH